MSQEEKSPKPKTSSTLKRNPLETTNFLFKLTFEWLTPLAFRGIIKSLELDDLWDLRPSEKAENLNKRLEQEWLKRKDQKNGLLMAIIRVFGLQFGFAGFLLFVYNCFSLASPIFLLQLFSFIQDPQAPTYLGYIWVVCLTLCQFIGLFFNHHYFSNTQMVGLKLKSSLSALIFEKAMRLSNRARVKKSNGEIVNLMSVDAQRLGDITSYLHMGWSGVFQMLVSIVVLFVLIGWPTVVGLSVIIVTIPLQILLIKIWGNLRVQNMKLSDARMERITELLQGISIIKFFNWEENYLKTVFSIRRKEIWNLFYQAILRGLVVTLMTGLPTFVSVGTFIVYVAVGYPLIPSIIFTAIAYFNFIRTPLIMMSIVVQFTVEGLTAIRRIQEYLLLEENPPLEFGQLGDVPLKLENCTFEWDEKPNAKRKKAKSIFRKKQKETKAIQIEQGQELKEVQKVGKMSNINLEVKKGSLVMVVGSVGSGKSSLLYGIIGEMRKVSGNVTINGSIAYCSQQAWIQNATLRDNITFGKPFDKQKYQQVIKTCALEKDLDILTYGDMTEIGEKGINLSGGQRQRVSIARAVYQDRDIYLFDDPLSAVDAHVGRHIFEQCIIGQLKDKTRILVTHQLQYLKYATHVVVINNGEIHEQGTYEELLNKKDGLLQRLIAEYTVQEKEQEEEKKEDKQKKSEEIAKEKEYKESEEERKKLAKLVQDEERTRGAISWRVIWDYFWYGGGPLVLIIIGIAYIITEIGQMASAVWMAIWIANIFPSLNNWIYPWGYMIIYASIAVAQGVITFLTNLGTTVFATTSSARIFAKAFKRVFHAPKWFFDTTPVGRFLNRFSNDQDMLDSRLPVFLQQTFATFFTVVVIFVLIGVVTQWFLIPMAVLLIIYFAIQQLYSRSSREIKRLEALTRSPLFAHFSESLNGISTIRSYQVEQQFIKESQKRVDTNQRCWFAQWMLMRWLGVRLDTIGALIIFSASIFIVASKGALEEAIAMVALAMGLMAPASMNFFVTQLTEAETQFNSAERLLYYTKVPNEPTLIKKRENEPPKDWPSKGEIIFDNYQMRYREGLELVLKGINLHIKPQEKVGIVGRTGAGKSSMILALFRMMEAAGGSISIDGLKISDVNLGTLRQRLSIIPQEPVLFYGTVRNNLDPFNQYDDKHLWEVLQKAHLKEKIEKLPLKLQAPVTAGGENFSVGERQLLCLARALCKKTKILLIDEATASVDLETDALIQKTIDREFADCTRLTIAHRLNTIMNSDRILVMDKGLVAEFDTPKNLLSNPNGLLTQLVNQTGKANAALLRSIVFGSEVTSEENEEKQSKKENSDEEIKVENSVEEIKKDEEKQDTKEEQIQQTEDEKEEVNTEQEKKVEEKSDENKNDEKKNEENKSEQLDDTKKEVESNQSTTDVQKDTELQDNKEKEIQEDNKEKKPEETTNNQEENN